MNAISIEPSWKTALINEFDTSNWRNTSESIRQEYLSGSVYPPAKEVFKAFDLCPFDKVKVVIVGQDPYHNVGQANGLAFSVNDGISLPPSLKNIFKEIHNDLGIDTLTSGDLSRWAQQGVLLLNSVLTVRAHNPASHAGRGWELFTDAVISQLNEKKDHIVYLLWGKYAQKKGEVIDKENNLVLTSAHPSPYSATMFFGNHHFSRANEYLIANGKSPVDWR